MRIPALVVAALLIVPHSALALPEYAAREGKACSHCHLDPGGGGPRNARGQYYERHDHSFEGYDETAGASATQPGGSAGPLQTLLETLSFSGNLLVCYSAAEGQHAGTTSRCESCHARGERAPDQSFFLMQGEISVSARVSDRVSFVYSNDLGLTRDVYAVLRVGSGGAFVKAGAFRVPFGTEEIRDHNTLVESRHNVGSNLRDVGVQVALQNPRVFASLAVLNGGPRVPDGAPVLTSSFDRNGSPAVVARAGILSPGFRIGGSAMYEDSIRASRPRQAFGALFGSIFGNRWTVTAEVAAGQAELGGSKATNLGFVALGDVEPFDRWHFGAKVDWFDPDTGGDAEDDGETWYTAIIECEVSRNASVEIRGRIREEEGSDEVANDDVLTLLDVHF